MSIVQSEVLSQYADELATDFRFIAPDVTLTVFETFTVTANWNTEMPYAVDSHLISPGGVYVSNNKDTVAGMFDAYNGEPLSGPEHFIVEKRVTNAIVVWQPLGGQTDLKILPLSGWAANDPVLLLACDHEARCLSQSTVSTADNAIHFTYSSVVEGLDVQYYKLVKIVTQLYLPVLLAN
ncbi:MAG: hypothetical protein U9Q70_02150 [Chloroflexota bacterium]|nr:hypothetical protein [Chloroflexota bacterium]